MRRRCAASAAVALLVLCLLVPSNAVLRMQGGYLVVRNTYDHPEWEVIPYAQTFATPPAVFVLENRCALRSHPRAALCCVQRG